MSIPRYTIRAAEARDALELARLSGELGYPADAATMVRRLAELQARGESVVLVAAGNLNLWGWVSLERNTSLVADQCAEITGLVVDGQARECGIGRALIDHAEDWARQRGLLRLMVRSNVNRPASHHFYEHLGYGRSKSQNVYQKLISATLAG